MAAEDTVAPPQPLPPPPQGADAAADALSSSETPKDATASSASEDFDIVATYHRLLAEDPDLTKPVAAIEALIGVLRQTPASTAMETYEITGAQVERLHAAVPNALPVEAGTSLFMNFLGMSMRQPSLDTLSSAEDAVVAAGSGSGSGSLANNNGLLPPSSLDSFDKIRQHLLDNSQLFVQRAKDARDRMAARGCRLVRAGDVVLTAGGSRAVRTLLLKAAERLRRQATAPGGSAHSEPASAPSPFTVLYVSDERSHDESQRAMHTLRKNGIAVMELDASAVSYALEAHRVAAVFVGSEAVTHDGKLVSRIGTLQLAQLASLARPAPRFFVLAETHKFVRKLLLNNVDLARIGIRQGFVLPLPQPLPRTGPSLSASPAKPPLAFRDQVDVTPPTLVTNIITENGIIEPSGSYRIMSY